MTDTAQNELPSEKELIAHRKEHGVLIGSVWYTLDTVRRRGDGKAVDFLTMTFIGMLVSRQGNGLATAVMTLQNVVPFLDGFLEAVGAPELDEVRVALAKVQQLHGQDVKRVDVAVTDAD